MNILFVLLFALASLVSEAQTVKNFELKDLQNVTRTYNELKGEKITILDFWATWCKPCTKAIPELNKLYEEFKGKGVQIIGINCDGPRSISKVVPVSKSLNISYPVLIDLNASLVSELGVQAYPTLIILNSKGKVVWIHEGYVSGDGELIASEINKLIKQ